MNALYCRIVYLPILKRFGAVSLRIYAGDHRPPHFHLVSADEQVLVRIRDLAILAGEMSGGDMREALAWAKANRDWLLLQWCQLNERG